MEMSGAPRCAPSSRALAQARGPFGVAHHQDCPLTLTPSRGAPMMIRAWSVAAHDVIYLFFVYIYFFISVSVPHLYAGLVNNKDNNNTTANYISAKLLVGQSIENKQ